MDLNKFTIKSQQALQEAQQSATEHNNQALENGHVLKGVLKTDKHVTPFILKKIGANPKMIEQALDQIIADEFIKYNKDILTDILDFNSNEYLVDFSSMVDLATFWTSGWIRNKLARLKTNICSNRSQKIPGHDLPRFVYKEAAGSICRVCKNSGS